MYLTYHNRSGTNPDYEARCKTLSYRGQSPRGTPTGFPRHSWRSELLHHGQRPFSGVGTEAKSPTNVPACPGRLTRGAARRGRHTLCVVFAWIALLGSGTGAALTAFEEDVFRSVPNGIAMVEDNTKGSDKAPLKYAPLTDEQFIALKYAGELVGLRCDFTDCQSNRRRAYRWVHKPLVRVDMIPTALIDRERKKKYPVLPPPTQKSWALSCFDSQKQAESRLHEICSLRDSAYDKYGDHVADLGLKDDDGFYEKSNEHGHFNLYEHKEFEIEERVSGVHPIKRRTKA